jgi:hypothetical protein
LTPESSSGRLTVGRLTLTDDSEASLAASSPVFMIGSPSGQNLIMDSDEIISRNNGAVSTLSIQNAGGDLYLGTNGATPARVWINDNAFHIGTVEPTNKVNGMVWINSAATGVGGGVYRWSTASSVWVTVAN